MEILGSIGAASPLELRLLAESYHTGIFAAAELLTRNLPVSFRSGISWSRLPVLESAGDATVFA